HEAIQRDAEEAQGRRHVRQAGREVPVTQTRDTPMDFDFAPVVPGWRALMHGALVTVEVSFGAIALGCLVGLVIGLGRLDPRRRGIYALCSAYLTFVRGTPLLVQLFIWFFGLPVFGVQLPAFFCGIV